MNSLADALSPSAIVERLRSRGIEVSERRLREFAREKGLCRIVGRAIFFLPDDVEKLLDAMKPEPAPTSRPANLKRRRPFSGDGGLEAAREKLRQLNEAKKKR